jgi:hypothetical protein
VSSIDEVSLAAAGVDSRFSLLYRTWSFAARQASRLVLTTNHCSTASGSVIVSDLRTSASQMVCNTSSAVGASNRDDRAVCHKIGVRMRTRSPILA